MPTVYIHATLRTFEDKLDPEDIGIAGVYEVELQPDTPAGAFANAALDGFHDRLPIGNLDDFHFTVRETANRNSPAIATTDAHEGYQLSGFARSVESVPAEFQVLARFIPEAWINDNAVEIAGARDVDVTHDVLRLGREDLSALHQLADRRESSEELFEPHHAAVGHDGPYSIEVVDAVCQAFEVARLDEITEEMVTFAQDRAAPAPSKAPRP